MTEITGTFVGTPDTEVPDTETEAVLSEGDAEVDPTGSGDPEDVCGEPCNVDGAWTKCGKPNTHSVVFAGLPPQRFCAEHHVTAKPIVSV